MGLVFVIGGLAIGALGSIGGIAVGTYAIGSIAVGFYKAIGSIAIAKYPFGALKIYLQYKNSCLPLLKLF